jgi:hypothetical protein
MNHREFVEFVEALPRPPWQPPVNSAWGGPNAQMGAMIQYYNPVDGTLFRNQQVAGSIPAGGSIESII